VRLGDPSRIFKFAVVGTSGVGVNMFFFWFFRQIVGIDLEIASPIAVELSIVSNFLLNDYWTFSDAVKASPFRIRLARFHVAAAGGFLINYLVLLGLVRFFGVQPDLANLIGIAVAFLWNYTFNVKWTWRQTGE
jgi:dolichol-phosphate mannosyltransferase